MRVLMLLLLLTVPTFSQEAQRCPIKRVKVEGCNPNNQSACYIERPVCGPAKVEEKKSKKSRSKS